jgi:DNA-binding NtrC family response regulator
VSDSALRVLLVDDDLDLVKSLSGAMEKLGLRVITAGTAAGALTLMADPAIPIDVIVMDLVLPDSWGSQVAMERTVYRPDVPVVYISGYARGDAVLAASTVGDVGPFLEKPFTPDELVALVRRVHSDHRSRS